MTKIKVLNLYAGIGGNRKLWENVDVTAVENNKEIAKIYQDFFPEDNVVVADAHQYLLDHFKEFDFIWSSIPCITHSRIRHSVGISRGQVEPSYADMNLYQEVIFLNKYFSGYWLVENVIPYYEPLIKPTIYLGNHCFWSNFYIIKKRSLPKHMKEKGSMEVWERAIGLSIKNIKIKTARKDQIMRNCVIPELGLHVFECAFKIKQRTLMGGSEICQDPSMLGETS